MIIIGPFLQYPLKLKRKKRKKSCLTPLPSLQQTKTVQIVTAEVVQDHHGKEVQVAIIAKDSIASAVNPQIPSLNEVAQDLDPETKAEIAAVGVHETDVIGLGIGPGIAKEHVGNVSKNAKRNASVNENAENVSAKSDKKSGKNKNAETKKDVSASVGIGNVENANDGNESAKKNSYVVVNVKLRNVDVVKPKKIPVQKRIAVEVGDGLRPQNLRIVHLNAIQKVGPLDTKKNGEWSDARIPRRPNLQHQRNADKIPAKKSHQTKNLGENLRKSAVNHLQRNPVANLAKRLSAGKRRRRKKRRPKRLKSRRNQRNPENARYFKSWSKVFQNISII